MTDNSLLLLPQCAKKNCMMIAPIFFNLRDALTYVFHHTKQTFSGRLRRLENCRGPSFFIKGWASCPIARRVRPCPRPLLALESGWTNQRSPPRVQPFCKKIKQVCRPTFDSDLQFFFLCNGRVSVKERHFKTKILRGESSSPLFLGAAPSFAKPRRPIWPSRFSLKSEKF